MLKNQFTKDIMITHHTSQSYSDISIHISTNIMIKQEGSTHPKSH